MNEQTKPGPENDPKSTPNDKEQKSMADKAAESMAGGNSFLETLLKMLLSPITLILGGAVLFFWMGVTKKDKELIEKLRLEVQELQDKCSKLKKKKKNLAARLEQTIKNAPEPAPLYGFSGQVETPKPAFLD